MRGGAGGAALLVLLGGCFSDAPADTQECRNRLDLRYFPNSLDPSLDPFATDGRQPYDLLTWASAEAESPRANVTIHQDVAPVAGWSVAWTDLGATPNLRRVRLSPASPAGPVEVAFERSYRIATPSCVVATPLAPHGVDLRPPAEGILAEPGKGAWVHTVGFFPNGTVFYSTTTDILKTRWAMAHGWQAPRVTAPLRVYVYEHERGERPSEWNLTAPPPVAGLLDPGLDYVTTIEGFNEALRGLSNGTSRIVLVPPEKAYTLPEKKDHRLYGETLIFWIKVARVVDIPCPEGAAPLLDPVEERAGTDFCRPASSVPQMLSRAPD